MTFEIVATLLVVGGVLVLLTASRLDTDVVLVGALIVLTLAGVLGPDRALHGFARNGVMTIAALYIVVAGLRETGAMAWISRWVLGRPRSLAVAQSKLMFVTSGLSAVINNTPVVALFIPVAQEWASRFGYSISKLLLPMNHIVILAGMCTLIGTSTNLIVNSLLVKTASPHFRPPAARNWRWSEGTLVYVPGTAASAARPIDWLTRDGKTAVLRATNALWGNPRFSPNGLKLAVDISDGTQRDIWVYEWARDTLTQLTFDPGEDRFPVWTPDGRRLVFASDRGKAGTFNLYWANADGTGEVTRLTDSPESHTQGSSWHPSGQFLPFQADRGATRSDLMILPIEGDATRGWTPGTPTVFLSSPANHKRSQLPRSASYRLDLMRGHIVIGGVTSFGINGNCAGTGGVYRVDRADDLDWLYETFGALLP